MNPQSSSVTQTIKVPSDIKYVRKVSSKVLSLLKSRKIDESILFDIRLCTEEVVRNAIQHGNRSDKKSSVKIDCKLDNDKFTLEVEDIGGGFDHRKIPDPTVGDNIMKGSGRGIYLVRHLMDEVEFNDKGNKVKLTKYLK